MKNFLIFTGLFLGLISCNTKQNRADQKNIQEKEKAVIQQNECFASFSQQDSIWLKLDFSENMASGILIYHFFEKDSNKGSLQGVLKGDTLVADYTFQSEGKTSVREVAFLIKKDSVVEGFGNMEEHNKKQRFKNNVEIDFSKGIIFKKIDCVAKDSIFRVD